MYLLKNLNDEIKKLRKENKTLSKNLNQINREYFLLIKKNFFKYNSNYNNLDNTKKLLFKNESDYENHKFVFEELDDFYKYRKFILISTYLFFSKRLYFGKANIIPNFNLKFFLNCIEKSKKKFFAKTLFYGLFSFFLFKYEKKYFEFEISNKLSINSRLGIYLWFESNYRKRLLNHHTFNFLDDYFTKRFGLIDTDFKSDLNEEILENTIFYYLFKQHYFNIYVTKTFNNLITPFLNNEKKSDFEKAVFVNKLNKNFIEKVEKEKFYYFDSDKNEEKNYKRINIFNGIKDLFKNTFNEEYNGFENKKSDKLFLTEDSLGNLIRQNELNQIFLNDLINENLKKSYLDYKKGNI